MYILLLLPVSLYCSHHREAAAIIITLLHGLDGRRKHPSEPAAAVIQREM